MNIHIITTGGTIDKTYDTLTGELTFTHSYIPQMLERIRFTGEYFLTHIFAKDSLDMIDDDRELIRTECEKSSHHSIIITHGTDTMIDTAKCLVDIKNKTIVLSGAMIPYSIRHSDGFANFGFALGAVKHLPYGVYIAMNGKIFEWDNVVKDKEKGIFTTLTHHPK